MNQHLIFMNNILKFLFLLLFSILFYSSCSSDDNDISIPSESPRYYVKYEVSFHTQHINRIRTISYTDEKGRQTKINEDRLQDVKWEGSYGPVNRDFVASLDCSLDQYDYGVIHGIIYVSREKEPFVIKAEGSNLKNSKELSLTYKIDF